MSSFAAAPVWIPEDDFRLKNALEAGASLESLAKGAVRFSRTYSLTQLRDRWLSILYDSEGSAQASASMLHLELSKSTGAGTKEASDAGNGGSAKRNLKRKFMTIRKQYYARRKMRKIIRREVLDSLDIGFDDRLSIGVNNEAGDDGKEIGGNLSKDTNHLLVNSCSEGRGGPGGLDAPGGAVLREEVQDGLVLDETAVEKPDCDNVVSDNVDSLPLSSPCDIIQGNDASVVPESQKLDTETKLVVPSGSSAAELEVVANPLGENRGDNCLVSDPGNEVQSSAAAAPSPPRERSEDLPTCVLNTEDTDIPFDDSLNVSVVVPHSVAMKSKPVADECVNVSVVVPRSVALKSQPIAKEVGCSDSFITNQRKNEPGGSLKKEEVRSHSFAAPQTVRSGLVYNTISSNKPVGVVLKTENPKAEDHMASKKSEEKSLLRSEEGGDDNDNENDDGNSDEDEIPYFDEAEKMILEMDLCPVDEDINPSREVLEYQHEETKRAIMRLEQCAQSFTQRAIASEGALAVLYGRKMKQYIKKSEVILGRATDGVHVDIDLGREGRANKISRRQALIKMDANGSFIIKNIGKRSIFLNGKEVAHGQLRGLSASCLIEISGLAFIFEFSNKAVGRVSENAVPKRES